MLAHAVKLRTESERSEPSGGWSSVSVMTRGFYFFQPRVSSTPYEGTEGGYLLAPRVPPLPFAAVLLPPSAAATMVRGRGPREISHAPRKKVVADESM
jgi:hypothetical protein